MYDLNIKCLGTLETRYFILKQRQKELYINGTYGEVMGLKRELYKQGTLYARETDYNKVVNYDLFPYDQDTVDECLRIRSNRKGKVHRLKERLTYWAMNRGLTCRIYFVTFTLTNKVLETTTMDSRIQYIRRKLAQFALDYWGNLDYGVTTHREHYHFIVVTLPDTDIETELQNFPGRGFLNIKECMTRRDDIDKLSNYTDKLSLHALKLDTDRNIIAKRGSDFHRFDELKHYIRKHKDFWLQFPEHHKALREWLLLIDKDLWMTAIDHVGHLDYAWWFDIKPNFL